MVKKKAEAAHLAFFCYICQQEHNSHRNSAADNLIKKNQP